MFTWPISLPVHVQRCAGVGHSGRSKQFLSWRVSAPGHYLKMPISHLASVPCVMQHASCICGMGRSTCMVQETNHALGRTSRRLTLPASAAMVPLPASSCRIQEQQMQVQLLPTNQLIFRGPADWAIKKHIPKSARAACAGHLASLLRSVVAHPEVAANWLATFNWSGTILCVPARGGKKHNLTSCIKKRCETFSSSSRHKPEVIQPNRKKIC